jgi:hypothetical protein
MNLRLHRELIAAQMGVQVALVLVTILRGLFGPETFSAAVFVTYVIASVVFAAHLCWLMPAFIRALNRVQDDLEQVDQREETQ